MKKKLLLLVLLLLAVGGGVYWWQFMHKAPRDTTQLTLYGNVEIREVDLASTLADTSLQLKSKKATACSRDRYWRD